MSAQTITVAGQRAAERLMIDSCTISAHGAVVTDPGTGVVTQSETVMYSGKCKVQSVSTVIQEAAVAGEHKFSTQNSVLHLPVTASYPPLDATVTITASTLSPSLVGRKYRVVGSQPKTFETAQRVQIEEVIG